MALPAFHGRGLRGSRRGARGVVPEPADDLTRLGEDTRARAGTDGSRRPGRVSSRSAAAPGSADWRASTGAVRRGRRPRLRGRRPAGPAVHTTQAASSRAHPGAGSPAASRARTVGMTRTASFWEPSPATFVVGYGRAASANRRSTPSAYPRRSQPGGLSSVGSTSVAEQVRTAASSARVRGGVRHEPVPGEQAPVGERGVRGVEHAQLGLLVGGDVRHELDAGELPARPPCREDVLEHPLGERLGDDGPRVVDARGAQPRPVGVRRRRDDPVDHGRREGDVAPGPSRPAVGRGTPRGPRRPGRRRGRWTAGCRRTPR